MNQLENYLQMWLNKEVTLSKLYKNYNIDASEFLKYAASKGYYIQGRTTVDACINRKQAIEEYLSTDISFTAMCKKYTLESSSMKKLMTSFNLLKEPIKSFIKGDYDYNIFDEIDTEEKAYWLGFIFADGYLNSSPLFEKKKDDFTIELSLSLKDLDHLNKFKEFIKYSKEIKTDDYRCRFYVSNKHLWTTLASYGCTPLKSLILSFPNENIFKTKDLIRHFIRGYFDGDGWITYTSKDHQNMSCGILGTLGFLTCVKNYVNSDNKLEHNHNNEEESTMKLLLSGSSGLRFLHYLYKDSNIYLERKYDKYLEFCRLYEESYKLLEDNIGEPCDGNTEIN